MSKLLFQRTTFKMAGKLNMTRDEPELTPDPKRFIFFE